MTEMRFGDSFLPRIVYALRVMAVALGCSIRNVGCIDNERWNPKRMGFPESGSQGQEAEDSAPFYRRE